MSNSEHSNLALGEHRQISFESVLAKLQDIATRIQDLEEHRPVGQAWQDSVLELYDAMGRQLEWVAPEGHAILIPGTSSLKFEHMQAEYGNSKEWVPHTPHKSWHEPKPDVFLADIIEATLAGVYAYGGQFRCRVDNAPGVLSSLILIERA